MEETTNEKLSIIIIIVLLIGVITIPKFFNKERKTEISNNKTNRTQFAMYKQKSDKSGYEIYTGSGFPDGQKINLELTTCVDSNNNTVNNVLEYANGKFTITSNKTVFCTLYFDLVDYLAMNISSSNPLVQEYRGDGYYHDENDRDTSNPFFTKPIYYWNVPTNTYQGNAATENAEIVRNSWNVIYAGYCWQMIRTTESGGVKLLYNGKPDIGEDLEGNITYDCSDNRTNYYISDMEFEYDLSGIKVYTDSYTKTVSGSTTTYTLVNSDSSTPGGYNISASNASSVVGKYTCGNTSTSCTNADLKKVVSIKDGTIANVNVSTEVDNIGSSMINPNINSIAYAGYMYNDHTANLSAPFFVEYPLADNISNIKISSSISAGMMFSDTAPTWNSSSKAYNALSGAKTASTIKTESGLSDYSALVGKYTLAYSNASYTGKILYYVVAVNNTTMYLRASVYGGIPSNTNTTTYTIGTSIADNKNGYYTISNTNNYDITAWTSSVITPNSTNFYYMCADGVSTTCSYGEARFISSNSASAIALHFLTSNNTTYGTYKVASKVVPSGSNAYSMSNSPHDELPINLNRNFGLIGGFVCISGESICPKEKIYFFGIGSQKTTVVLTPDMNFKFSDSYTYNNGTYTLNMNTTNSMGLWDKLSNNNSGTALGDIGKAHYVCLDENNEMAINTTSCSSVGYVFGYAVGSSSYVYFVPLSNGQYINTNINNQLYQENNNLLWKMLYSDNVNTTDSIIKKYIDEWYEINILNSAEESLIDEDEIYCSDRSTSNNFGNWNINASNLSTNMQFSGLGYKQRQVNSQTFNEYNISCPRKTDAYSKNETAKGNGALSYAVGLISYPEMININQSSTIKSFSDYWLSSPTVSVAGYSKDKLTANKMVLKSGVISNGQSTITYRIRPSIALKSSAAVSRGTGSMTDPYVVEVSNS